MNILRFLFGTRRKQWHFLTLCIILAIVGYLYWAVNGLIIQDKPEGEAGKLGNSSKLHSYLFRIRPTRKALTKVTRNVSLFITRTVSEAFLRRDTVPLRVITTEQSQQQSDILTTESLPKSVATSLSHSVSYNVHIFYYPWYGNPSFDGKYVHWNHQYIPHWNSLVAKNYEKGVHVPPDDIGSDFYPELGCYSSRDPNTIAEHMRQIRSSGAGVVVVSWYPKGKADEHGIPVDELILKLLDIANMFGLKITLHIEPYKNRNEKTVRDDVVYITKTYSSHPAFYKYKTKDGHLPLIYVYDSYHTPPHQWANLLKTNGMYTIRNTPYDCVMIALMVEQNHRQFIEIGGFDGFYTYFAVNGFTYGSRWNVWSDLKAFAQESNSIFIPSVGPGYVDTSVRPWNAENTRSRQDGDYYKRSFKAALSVDPPLISITSFNEWHEGTQIEKAVPKSRSGFKYKDYLPHKSDYYLKLTKKYVKMFQKAGS